MEGEGRGQPGRSLAAGSVSPCTEGGREGGTREVILAEAAFSVVTARHCTTRGSDPSVSPMVWHAGRATHHLHTDVFWLLSLLGISFTPRDFSSICFLTREDREGKTVGGVVCDLDRVPVE